jgi:putative ABC transport system permease protein
MNWVAWKMLTGDRAKYLSIVFGITFASLLMSQQAAIFCGLMRNTASQILDIQGAEIWVMDPYAQFVDDLRPLSENDLYRVRSVRGVSWAVRLYKGLLRARMESGDYQQMIVLGLDDATLIGAPREIVAGKLSDLRLQDAVMIDEAGFHYVWPGEPLATGKVLELNDHRAVVVGICKASPPFQTFPVLYTRYAQAVQYAPRERKVLSFVLAQNDGSISAAEACRRITAQTGLQALTRDEFFWKTIMYYTRKTGIPINFGITVVLGFLVGAAIAGQTFYLFTIENLKQFGALKAMGVGNARLTRMILLQASIAGLLGYGLGVGLAVVVGKVIGVLIATSIPPAFFMPWQVLAGTGIAVLGIAAVASLVSIRRVVVLEPAVVFR